MFLLPYTYTHTHTFVSLHSSGRLLRFALHGANTNMCRWKFKWYLFKCIYSFGAGYLNRCERFDERKTPKSDELVAVVLIFSSLSLLTQFLFLFHFLSRVLFDVLWPSHFKRKLEFNRCLSIYFSIVWNYLEIILAVPLHLDYRILYFFFLAKRKEQIKSIVSHNFADSIKREFFPTNFFYFRVSSFFFHSSRWECRWSVSRALDIASLTDLFDMCVNN